MNYTIPTKKVETLGNTLAVERKRLTDKIA